MEEEAFPPVEEAFPVEEYHLAAPETACCEEEHYTKPEGLFSKNEFPAEETLPKENPVGEGESTPEVAFEASQVNPFNEDFDDVKESTLDQYDEWAQDLVRAYAPSPGPDVVPICNAPTKDAKVNPYLPPPPAATSTAPSVPDAAAPEAPT